MRTPLLERLALHRPELRAWAMYDWANSAFITVIVTTIWPIYYNKTINFGQEIGTVRHSYFTAASLAFVAILAPLLGVVADKAPVKKRLLGTFLTIGVFATIGLAFVGEGQWLLGGTLFALGSIGASASFVFYDALLPHVANDEEMDRVSTAGYAIGYLGGGILLVFLLVLVLNPTVFGLADSVAASKVAFVIVAGWWLVFSIPMFRKVSEPPLAAGAALGNGNLLKTAFAGVRKTASDLKKFPQAFLFLIAFLIYNDGIGTIMRMAAIFGAEKGIASGDLILAIVLVQFVGIPFTFAFGQFAGKIGIRKAIYVGLVVYCLVSVVGYFMDGFQIGSFVITPKILFFVLAGLVGLVQGGVQALSRSLFASMIPKTKSSEFFGLFAVFERFAGIFGPLLFGFIVSQTGSSQNAILAIIGFFAVGGFLLSKVNIDDGRAQAALANRNATLIPADLVSTD